MLTRDNGSTRIIPRATSTHLTRFTLQGAGGGKIVVNCSICNPLWCTQPCNCYNKLLSNILKKQTVVGQQNSKTELHSEQMSLGRSRFSLVLLESWLRDDRVSSDKEDGEEWVRVCAEEDGSN